MSNINIGKPNNPRIGDIYLDILDGRTYIYTGTSNRWVESISCYLLPRSTTITKAMYCKLKDIPGIVTLAEPTMQPGHSICNRLLVSGLEIVFDRHNSEVRTVECTDEDIAHVTGINFDPNIDWHADIILDNTIVDL